MSRPLPILFALSLSAFSFGISGCSTIYRPIYSNEKNHFKPPGQYVKADGTKQKTADEIMKEQDAAAAAQNATTPSTPLDPGLTPAPAAMPDAAAPMATPPAATPPN